MHLRRRTVKRIQSMVWFAVVYTAIGSLWEYIEMSQVTFDGPGAGLAVGLTLAILENSRVFEFTSPMSFSAAIFVKSLIYLGVIAIPVCAVGFFFGLVGGLTMADFRDWVFSADLVVQLVIIYGIHLVVIFVRHLNKLLGPGTLVRYISGKYHKPSVEQRVFMFLDLKSSTTLAEAMGEERYYAFLNACFRDMTEPILERSAEIYQYVGDEVILTWPLDAGMRDANCIRVFVEILAQMHSRREYYMREYGHVPEFKAGIHFGDVIAAEIGDIKKEISYYGDVLNTAARIQAKCNELGHLLIATQELVAALELPRFVKPEALGAVALRGKSEATELVGLYQA